MFSIVSRGSTSTILRARLRSSSLYAHKYCRKKRFAQLMQENHLNATKKRRKVRTTNSNHLFPVASNLLEQDFTADAPHKKWVTYFTCVATREGHLFVAGILDTYSRADCWMVDE